MSRDIITELQLQIAALQRQLAEKDAFIAQLRHENHALWTDPIGYRNQVEEWGRQLLMPSQEHMDYILSRIAASDDIMQSRAGQRR